MKRAIVAVGIIVAVGCGLHLPPIEWPVPEPTPVPAPTPTPTPCPAGTTAVDGACVPNGPIQPPIVVDPDPDVIVVKFPVRFPKPGVIVYARNHRYGNGIDSTLRINGDRALCEALHHVPVPNGDCHLDSDVWTDAAQRPRYEGLVYAGARDGDVPPDAPLGPVWQYRAGGEFGRCHNDQVHVNTSCDHFGNAVARDDPRTPEFEGAPAWLGVQRDEFGPYAGFFTIPQTSGPGFGTQVRSCPPLDESEAACGPWVVVDWK